MAGRQEQAPPCATRMPLPVRCRSLPAHLLGLWGAGHKPLGDKGQRVAPELGAALHGVHAHLRRGGQAAGCSVPLAVCWHAGGTMRLCAGIH